MQSQAVDTTDTTSSFHAEDSLLDETLRNILKTGTINVLNFPTIVVELMKTVEKIKNVEGIIKKQLVISCVQRYVDKNQTSEYVAWLNLLPSLIDTMISVDKHTVRISNPTWCCI